MDNQNSLNEIAIQLKRIADSLEKMTKTSELVMGKVPEINASPEQIKDLERALMREPLNYLYPNKGTHQNIVDAWNNELVPLGIPRINGIKNNRAKMVSARIKEYGEDAFFECIEEVKQSSFLQGKTKKPWTGFSFDWLICPSNFPKVLEGNYNDNRKNDNTDPNYNSALPESWLK